MTLGDFVLESTIDFHFTTRRFSTGAPFTLAGTPVISAYEDNSVTQITAGVTLTADFDAVTGLNHVRVAATAANGFEAGKSYSLVITTGTVDSVSVVGEVVGYFTIERSAAFARLGAPAGASVSADVAAVKVDTAAILVDTGTTLQAEVDGIQADTEDIQARLPAALVGGRIDASVGAMAANVVTATAIAADAITAAKVAADVSAEIADAVWDEDATGHQTLGTFGQAIGDPVADSDTIWGLVNTNLNATVSSRAAQTTADAIEVDTQDIQTRLPAALVTGRMSSDVVAISGSTVAADNVEANIANLDATVSTRATPAQVNTEVLDVLNTDTFAEPGQGAPAATATLVAKIGHLYKAWRNRSTQTANQYSLYADDATTIDQKATFSDNGTTADRGEVATGP